jgi:hypothetical protein
MSVLLLLLGVCVSAAPSTLTWNGFIAQNFQPSTAYTAASESREFALYLAAAHDGLNSVRGYQKYYPYVSVLYTKIKNTLSDDVIVAAAYKTLLKYNVAARINPNGTPFFSASEQAAKNTLIDNFYTTFITNLNITTPKVVSRGEALGIAAANSIWNARANDGFNRTAPDPYFPVKEQIGKWWPKSTEPLVYPGKGFEKPISLPTPYHIMVPPPVFDMNNPDYLADLAFTKEKGAKFGSSRTPEESRSAQFAVLLAGARYQTAIYNQLHSRFSTYLGWDLRDFVRFQALAGFCGADSYTAITNIKNMYNSWRPYQAINYGNDPRWAADFPGLAALADPTWESFQPTPPNQEYPGGHSSASSCVSHTIRLTTGWELIPGGPITVNAPVPGINETYTSLGEIEYKMVLARIFGGMHLKTTNQVGSTLGRRIVEYTIGKWLKPAPNTWNPVWDTEPEGDD